MNKNNSLSSFIYPVLTFCDEKCLYISSGFLYRKGTNFYFITALSTVLGRNVPNGEFKFNKKQIPDSIQTNFSVFKEDLISINRRIFPIKISIYNNNFEPNFFIHPTYKKEVDIAVFPIDIKGIDFVALNDFDTIYKSATQDIFVVGYPLFPNKTDDKNTPVFKMGQITQERKNIFIINNINRIGLFGSAVFEKTDLNENAFCFLGLCSGCESLNTKNHPTLVWKKTLIEEIILGQHKESCID